MKLHAPPPPLSLSQVIPINEEIIRRILADASTKGFALFKRNLYTILRERKTLFVIGFLLLPALLSFYWAVEVRFEEDTELVRLTAHEIGNDVEAELGLPEFLFTGADLRFPVKLSNAGDREVKVFMNGSVQKQRFSGGPFPLGPRQIETEEVFLPTGNLTVGMESEVLLYVEIEGTDYPVEQLLRDIEENGFTYDFVITAGPQARNTIKYSNQLPPWLGITEEIDIYKLVELYNATELKQNAIQFFEMDVLSDPVQVENRLNIPKDEDTLSFEYENHSKEITIQMPEIMTFDRDTTVKGWVVDNASSWRFHIKAYTTNPYDLILESPVFNSDSDKIFNITFPDEAFTDDYGSHGLILVYFFENEDGTLITEFGAGARYRKELFEVVVLSSALDINPRFQNLNFVKDQDAVFAFIWPLLYAQGVPTSFTLNAVFYVPHGDAVPYNITMTVGGHIIYNASFSSAGESFNWLTPEFKLDELLPGSLEINITVFNGFLNEYRYIDSFLHSHITLVGLDDFYEVVQEEKHGVVATYGIDLVTSLEFPELLSTRDDETVYLELRNDGLTEHDITFVVSIQSENYETSSTVNGSENKRVPLKISTAKLDGEEDVKVSFLLMIKKIKEEEGRSVEEMQEFFQGFVDFDPDDFINDGGGELRVWEDEEAIYISVDRDVQIVETKKENQIALSLFLQIFTQLYLLFLVLIVCMVYGSMMIKDEVENKTLHLLLTSPLTKFEIIIYKYLAYVVGVFVILLIPITVNYIVISSTLGLHEALLNVIVLSSSLFIVFLAVVCYGAIYMFIGNLPRHPILLGVTYAIFWESFVTRLPIFIQYFTVNHYIRSVMLPLMEGYVMNSRDILWLNSAISDTSLATPQATALLILTIIPFFFLFFNILFLKYRDYS